MCSTTAHTSPAGSPCWQLFQQGDPAGLVCAVVEHILYDGSTGAVTLTLGNGGGQP